MTEIINDKGICRTAQATPGLLNIKNNSFFKVRTSRRVTPYIMPNYIKKKKIKACIKLQMYAKVFKSIHSMQKYVKVRKIIENILN